MEDSGTWSFGLSTSSRSYRSALKSFSDLCIEFEEMEMEGDDDLRVDYPCPFCAEDFDLVELCHHIDDEHPVEAKFGLQVCPVCAESVRMNIVGHIIAQHGDMFKISFFLIYILSV
uniref:Di19 zinc-binding domain-containing protein n=1 Tax=Rhizophora mucronata TaxID=61149 RepID=A0A2P2IKD4_RHIMU